MWIEQKCLGGKKGFVRSMFIYFSFGLCPEGIVGQTDLGTFQRMRAKRFGVSFFPSLCCHLIASEKSPRGLGNLLGGFFPTEGHRGGCQRPPGCPKPKAEDVLGKPSPGRGRSLQFPCSGIPWDHTLLLFQQCQTLLGSTWPLPRFRASLATNPFSHIHNCSLC